MDDHVSWVEGFDVSLATVFEATDVHQEELSVRYVTLKKYFPDDLLQIDVYYGELEFVALATGHETSVQVLE